MCMNMTSVPLSSDSPEVGIGARGIVHYELINVVAGN